MARIRRLRAARAVLPTPLGRLAVAWTRRADGGCDWQVEAPPGMAVEGV